MKKQIKNKKGITLIALVVTIIILLILAGVALSLVAGENGILGRTVNAREKTIKAQYEEELNLVIASMRADAMYERKEFDIKFIIENLPDYLEEEGKTDYDWDRWQASNEPTGVYKGYEFYIDTRCVAHIEGKSSGIKEENFTITLENIGPTSVTVTGNIEELNEIEATEFTYIALDLAGNEIKYEHIESASYTLTDLKPETEYLVYMIAYDNSGNQRRSIRENIKTAELYKWEKWNLVEEVKVEIQETDYSSESASFSGVNGYCIYETNTPIQTTTSTAFTLYSEYKVEDNIFVGSGTKYEYFSNQYNSTIGKYFVTSNGKKCGVVSRVYLYKHSTMDWVYPYLIVDKLLEIKEEKEYIKGELLEGEVTSEIEDAYPEDGYNDNKDYWYVKK